MSRIPLVSKGWGEGRLWDLWMGVHFLTGVSGGLSNVFLKLPPRDLWLTAITLMSVWEIIEYARGIREKPENRVMDLIVGLLGVYVATSIASMAPTPIEQVAFFAVTILTTVGCFFGWRAYRKRRSKVA